MAYGTVEYVRVDNDGLTPTQRKLQIIGAVVAVIVVLVVIITTVVVLTSSSDGSANSGGYSPLELEEEMDIEDIVEYLNDLQNIAYQYNGSRAPAYGYNASVAYIVKQLEDNTDWKVTTQYFTVYIVMINSPSQLNQTSPSSMVYINGKDFLDFQAFAGKLVIPDNPVYVVPNLGCNATDYADFPRDNNHIALIKRGSCTFAEKVIQAMEATAVAALIYNDGAAPDRQGPFTGSMSGVVSTIPVFGLSYTLGTSLSEVDGLRMSLSVDSTGGNQTTMNVIAETSFGSSSNVIIVGSHLDSVPAGPGINDNGSGSSVNLELALALAELKLKTVNKIRFAWWGAEEMGLLGSKYYVSQLSEQDKANIALNINMDMVGSPNYFIGIYNGSMANETIQAACTTIQELFQEAFENRGLPYKLTPFTGRSDYGPFIDALIPAGGLFTGAEEIKTAEDRHNFGGVANAAYDPCYHQACDTVENINTEVLEDMSQALGYVVQTLAMQKNLREYLNEP